MQVLLYCYHFMQFVLFYITGMTSLSAGPAPTPPLPPKLRYIMKVIILFLVVAITSTAKAHKNCPKFWLFFKGNCYRYIGERLAWAGAESRCNSFSTSIGINTHLASVHSQEENRFVYELFRSSVEDYPDWVPLPGQQYPSFYGVWLGLYLHNRQWVYTDASPVNYYNWKNGAPDNDYMGRPENCAHIFRNNDFADTLKHWNDLLCDEHLSFICKMPAPPCFSDLTTTTSDTTSSLATTDVLDLPSSSPTAMVPERIRDFAPLTWFLSAFSMICVTYSFVISIFYCKLRRTAAIVECPPKNDGPCTELNERSASDSQAKPYETLAVTYIGPTYATISSPVYQNH